MADKKNDKPGSTNPRGAENVNPFDKATERRDNQLPDESEQGNTNLPTGTVKSDEQPHTGRMGGIRESGSTKPADSEQGFVAFNLDIYQLTDLYANVRDGNYWSAFRIAVEILHSNFTFDTKAVRGTPNQRMAARARTQQPVSKAQISDVKAKLEECCNDLEKQQGQQLKVTNKPTAVGASQEKNVGKIDLAGLLALVRMILQLFQEHS